KGEKGIRIFGGRDIVTTKEDERTGEEKEQRTRRFFPVSVFDMGQTDPIGVACEKVKYPTLTHDSTRNGPPLLTLSLAAVQSGTVLRTVTIVRETLFFRILGPRIPTADFVTLAVYAAM
ncbi:MAG: hypothetical protein RSA54_04130, partial [Glutamicibacter sp.]